MDEFSSLLDVAGSYCKSRAANLVKSHIFASLMGPYSSTISNFICVNGRSDKDWSAEYRLYSKERVDADSFYNTSLNEICNALPDGEPIVFGVDDTLSRKTGRKIDGVAWRRDPLGPAFRTNLVRGQRFLMFSAAWKIGNGEAQMLPVYFEHAPTATRPSSKATEEELAEWRKEKKRMSLGTRAVAGFDKISNSLPERKIIAVGDGGYTTGFILKNMPSGISYIGRMRKDAKLFYPPSEHHVTKNGRPRSYGDRAPTPEELRQNDSILCKEVEAVASGRRHTFRVKEIKNLLWRPAGAKISVRVIVIAPTGYRLRKGSKLLYRQPAYLLCTDDNLPIEEVLQYYLWRWGVEVNFRDVKELIGVGDAMVRTEPSNRILPAVLVGGYSLLWIAALKMMSKEVNPVSRLVAPKWRAELEANRTKPSTGQLLRQIRAECLSEAIESYTFDGFVSGKVMDTKPKKLGIKLRGIIQTA